MKLLLDQNLSPKLLRLVADLFPGSTQTGLLGLTRASDLEVWEAARTGGHTLLSQDADFADLALHRGPPPKIVWLRCGNRPTTFIAALLRRRADVILAFDADPEAFCLEIDE